MLNCQFENGFISNDNFPVVSLSSPRQGNDFRCRTAPGNGTQGFDYKRLYGVGGTILGGK